jgi:hypothetical protein
MHPKEVCAMPPHCDSLDGPVVTAAQRALETEAVERALPFVPKDGEEEVRNAFELATKARTQGPEAGQVADLYFYETVVRVHRRGEGAPYEGLKPAGLDVGPVIPIAESAIERNSPEPLITFFLEEIQAAVADRFQAMLRARESAHEGVDAEREFVEAMLGLQVWSHKLYGCIHSQPHEGHGHG